MFFLGHLCFTTCFVLQCSSNRGDTTQEEMAADRARREAAEQRQQQLEQQMAHQQGLLEQQGQMMRWMTQQMLINSQPGTLPTPPFAFSWVSDQVSYCPMLAIFNLALLSNAHNFQCCRWTMRCRRLVGPRVDRTTRRRRLSPSTIRRSSGG